MEEEDDSEDLLNLLFERGPDFVLIESAKTGDEEMVRLLIENEEVNLNTEDDYGYTALCYAALKGLLFLIYYLFDSCCIWDLEKSTQGKTKPFET